MTLLLGIAAALGITTAAEAADVPGDKSTVNHQVRLLAAHRAQRAVGRGYGGLRGRRLARLQAHGPAVPADVPDHDAALRLSTWLRQHDVRTLNVAGSRESGAPDIGARVARVVELALAPD
jgi:hypothetical protein